MNLMFSFVFLAPFLSHIWAQPDDPAGFPRAPDVSELKILYYDCYPEQNKFSVKFKQLGYQQVVATSFRNRNVDKFCKHVESIYDEGEEWVVGFIQVCEIHFDETTSGRFEVKIFDGPLKLNHIRDSTYIDCTPPSQSSGIQDIPDGDTSRTKTIPNKEL